MNKKIFAKLCLNYGKEPNEDLYDLWNYNLRPYDEDEIQKAVDRIIATDKYFPTFSRILEIVKDVVSKEDFDYSNEDYIREKMKKHNIHPDWLDKEITNEPINEETKKNFDDLNKFIEEYRHEL